ncbi:MAG: pseudaminic acid cytidylyltransferase [Lachnospiraceae bacterium]|nr:pseudaminic acid cytidylyltransferase [Lachnospiraceae bacterium]
MSRIAIITARGGSRRIPKKNIREFCGKPIIAYSIEAALNSNCFDEVMVSTDSMEIKDVAEEYGASVPFMRSDETSNDFATTADVIDEVLNEYTKSSLQFEVFACIYPTAPFLTVEKICDAMDIFCESDADALISIVRFGFPPQRGFIISEGSIKYQYPQFERVRSQDLEPIYHDCGQLYICKSDEFKKHHSFIMKNTIPFIMKEEEVQDIDTESDWRIAESKYRAMIQ